MLPRLTKSPISNQDLPRYSVVVGTYGVVVGVDGVVDGVPGSDNGQYDAYQQRLQG